MNVSSSISRAMIVWIGFAGLLQAADSAATQSAYMLPSRYRCRDRTQTTDVVGEISGLMTCDRMQKADVKKWLEIHKMLGILEES